MSRVVIDGRRRAGRTSWLPVVGALVTVAATVGVVAPANLDLGDARERHASAARRVERMDTARAELARYRDDLGGASAGGAPFPTEVEALDLFGAVQVVANALDVQLDEVAVADPLPTELAVWDDEVLVREVALRGWASERALVAMPGEVAALGFPTCVLELDMSRSEVSERGGFRFALTLGAYEVAALGTATFEGAGPEHTGGGR